jgi:hypothetical protein
MLDDIKQLKFTSGEEIICRVVNYDADAEDDYGHYMIVDNVLQLDNQIVITQSDEPTAYTDRIYSFIFIQIMANPPIRFNPKDTNQSKQYRQCIRSRE